MMPQVSGLVRHRVLMRIGLSAGVFAWVFIFQFFMVRLGTLNFALIGVALAYALAQDVTLLFTPLAARGLRSGVNHLIAQAVVLAIVAYTALILGFSGFLGRGVGVGVLVFCVFLGLYRACYWVPFQVDASRNATNPSRFRAFREMFLALLPLFAGLILSNGYPAPIWLLVGAVACLIVSLVPLQQVEDGSEGFSWSYRQTYHELFTKRHRRLVLRSFYDGISGAALLLFWPIAVFLIVERSYFMLGLILTATFLGVLVFRDLIRTFLKYLRVDESVSVQAMLAASSWVMRIFVGSPLSIIVVDSYHYTSTPLRRTGVDPRIFEQSADAGSYVDEFTALKEIAMSCGKIALCLLAVLLAFSTSLPTTFAGIFILAAAASAASVLLAKNPDVV